MAELGNREGGVRSTFVRLVDVLQFLVPPVA